MSWKQGRFVVVTDEKGNFVIAMHLDDDSDTLIIEPGDKIKAYLMSEIVFDIAYISDWVGAKYLEGVLASTKPIEIDCFPTDSDGPSTISWLLFLDPKYSWEGHIWIED